MGKLEEVYTDIYNHIDERFGHTVIHMLPMLDNSTTDPYTGSIAKKNKNTMEPNYPSVVLNLKACCKFGYNENNPSHKHPCINNLVSKLNPTTNKAQAKYIVTSLQHGDNACVVQSSHEHFRIISSHIPLRCCICMRFGVHNDLMPRRLN